MTELNGNIQFTEAPASITFKISYRGFDDVLFTLRAGSGLELLAKIDPAIDKLESMGATPAHRGSARTNGNGAGPACPDGHGPMKASTKKAGSFYCPAAIAESAGKKIYCQQKA